MGGVAVASMCMGNVMFVYRSVHKRNCAISTRAHMHAVQWPWHTPTKRAAKAALALYHSGKAYCDKLSCKAWAGSSEP